MPTTLEQFHNWMLKAGGGKQQGFFCKTFSSLSFVIFVLRKKNSSKRILKVIKDFTIGVKHTDRHQFVNSPYGFIWVAVV